MWFQLTSPPTAKSTQSGYIGGKGRREGGRDVVSCSEVEKNQIPPVVSCSTVKGEVDANENSTHTQSSLAELTCRCGIFVAGVESSCQESAELVYPKLSGVKTRNGAGMIARGATFLGTQDGNARTSK